MDAREIIRYISESTKKTEAKAYIKGALDSVAFDGFKEFYRGVDFVLVVDDANKIQQFLDKNSTLIKADRVEVESRNSALPLADLTRFNARIEPGAIIREKAEIGDGCVIMMGAVINIGAIVGAGTMIDMNTVLGGRAIVGKNCHIGAGAVLAGVIEPPSATPVTVGDNVVIGANVVVLEGVSIGDGAVVAAGAVVLKDVAPRTVVAGSPAKVIKAVDDKTISKTELVEDLRKI